MFRQHPKEINEVLRSFMRVNGLETPWLQRKLLASWNEVVGNVIAKYTEQKDIRNQTLWVKISNPAVRADLQMRRSELVRLLNGKVDAQIITDIRVY